MGLRVAGGSAGQDSGKESIHVQVLFNKLGHASKVTGVHVHARIVGQDAQGADPGEAGDHVRAGAGGPRVSGSGRVVDDALDSSCALLRPRASAGCD